MQTLQKETEFMRPSPQKTKIAKLRVASGLLQKELADKLDVHPKTIGKLESGSRPSRALEARAMAVLRAR